MFQQTLEAQGVMRHVSVSGSTLTFTIVSASGTSTSAIRPLAYNLTVSKGITMRFESADGTDLSGSFATRTSDFIASGYNPAGHFQGKAGQRLVAILSTNALVKGHMTVTEVTL